MRDGKGLPDAPGPCHDSRAQGALIGSTATTGVPSRNGGGAPTVIARDTGSHGECGARRIEADGRYRVSAHGIARLRSRTPDLRFHTAACALTQRLQRHPGGQRNLPRRKGPPEPPTTASAKFDGRRWPAALGRLPPMLLPVTGRFGERLPSALASGRCLHAKFASVVPRSRANKISCCAIATSHSAVLERSTAKPACAHDLHTSHCKRLMCSVNPADPSSAPRTSGATGHSLA